MGLNPSQHSSGESRRKERKGGEREKEKEREKRCLEAAGDRWRAAGGAVEAMGLHLIKIGASTLVSFLFNLSSEVGNSIANFFVILFRIS